MSAPAIDTRICEKTNCKYHAKIICSYCSLFPCRKGNLTGNGCPIPEKCPKKNIMMVSSKFTIHIEKDPQFWRLDESVCNECIKESLK